MDSAENLIALPADEATRTKYDPLQLPMHRGPHPQYDAVVRTKLEPIALGHGTMSPTELHAAIMAVEGDMLTAIASQSIPATFERLK